MSLGPRKAIAVGNFNPSYTVSILILVLLPYTSPSSPEKDTLVMGERVANPKIRSLTVSATYTFPDDGSIVISSGNLIPSSMNPYIPTFDMKVPLLENTCILWFSLSATYTFPDDGSTAIPAGDLSIPSVVPYSPHFDIYVPLLVNTCILLLPVSATYTFPDDGFIVRSSGDVSLPSRGPNSPQTLGNFDIYVPLLVNTCILLTPVTATYTFPDDGSTAIPAGPNNFGPGGPPSINIGKKESCS